MAEKSLTEILEMLETQGYQDDFQARDGKLFALVSKRAYAPEDLTIDHTYRWEGDTDLGEETMLFALGAKDGSCKGSYVVAYGPEMDSQDVDMVQRLQKK